MLLVLNFFLKITGYKIGIRPLERTFENIGYLDLIMLLLLDLVNASLGNAALETLLEEPLNLSCNLGITALGR